MIDYIKNLFKRKYTYRRGEFTLRTKVDGTYQYYHSPTQQWLTWLVIMDDTEYMSEAELLLGTLLDMEQYQSEGILISCKDVVDCHFVDCHITDNVVYDNLTIKDSREDLQYPRKDDTPAYVSSSYTPSECSSSSSSGGCD